LRLHFIDQSGGRAAPYPAGVVTLRTWEARDPRSRQRGRWLALAGDECEAAADAGEDHVAEAFRIVVVTIEADGLPEPPWHGRVVLKGRAAAHDEVLRLAATGVSSRSVARLVGQPYSTVYGWLRRAGLVQTRARVIVGPT
jgi:hypothetical protein